MTLDEVLSSLFPNGHHVVKTNGLLSGFGLLDNTLRVDIIGVADRTAIGVDEAIRLSANVLTLLAQGGHAPILVLVDSDSQRMSKRDELLGLNEYLAHLAKCLIEANLSGRHTVGLLYGHTAAGAFLATALATRSLVALPGAEPEVMDLPSMSRVTKLSIDVLKQKAESTPIFAPGLDNLAKTGAVHVIWDETLSLAQQLHQLLDAERGTIDERDRLGRERGGRLKAAEIAKRVYDLALRSI
jgi:malonate decarboxylase gamma subunit